MVQLILSTTRGNSGNRFFPHQGYLGLTPVRVEGIVRTRVEEDGRPIPAKSLSVSIRCYQSRLTRSRSARSVLVVDHTDVLWVKPPTKDYADVGDLELPFKLTLPKHTPGPSSANYQDYRVFWRLEAILEHAPFPAVGSRMARYFDLALVRYDLPSSTRIPLPGHALSHTTNKPRAPVVRYNVSTPTTPIGPSDMIHATLLLQPLDPLVAIKSATVSLERRIELHNIPAAPTPLVTTGINRIGAASLSPTFPSVSPINHDEDTPTPTASHFQPQWLYGQNLSASSQYTFESGTTPSYSSTASLISSPTVSSSAATIVPIPRIPSQPPPSPCDSPISRSPIISSVPSTGDDHVLKTLTMVLTTADLTSFMRDSSGVWVKSVGLQWPEPRSNSRWAIGETMHSDFASVRFYLRTKIIVTGPSGSDALELDAREVMVVPTSEADRKVAMERWAEQKEISLRSKSKSPWRKRGEDLSGADTEMNSHGLPSPPQTPAQSSDSGDRRQSAHSERDRERKPRKKATRRPHTSAGPSDKSSLFVTNAAMSLGRPDRTHPEPISASFSRDSESSSSSNLPIKVPGRGDIRTNTDEGVRAKWRASREDGKRERDTDDDDREEQRGWRENVKAKPSLDLMLGVPPDDVRAWEDMLAHVESQSQRNSVGFLGVLGMSRKRTAR